jgi:hypothetical protein
MMRIMQTLAKQDMMALHQAPLSAMSGCMTYETTTSTKEEVGIVIQ